MKHDLPLTIVSLEQFPKLQLLTSLLSFSKVARESQGEKTYLTLYLISSLPISSVIVIKNLKWHRITKPTPSDNYDSHYQYDPYVIKKKVKSIFPLHLCLNTVSESFLGMGRASSPEIFPSCSSFSQPERETEANVVIACTEHFVTHSGGYTLSVYNLSKEKLLTHL